MTATEQWIFLCAAHKTPKEVSSQPSPPPWTARVPVLCALFMTPVTIQVKLLSEKNMRSVKFLCLLVCLGRNLAVNTFLWSFQCPAIDYTRHTLDGAACLLNSNKYFPSR